LIQCDQSLAEKTQKGHRCLLCPHLCDLGVGERGKCLVRQGSSSGIVLDTKITTIAVEPIEKKPFFHFKPGSNVLSLGNYGCNLDCPYCQNFMVSQRDRSQDAKEFDPKDIIDLAHEKKVDGICLTYNEPTIYYEYLMKLAKLSYDNDLFFCIKTNALVNIDCWRNMFGMVSAFNIDWKGDEASYYNLNSGLSDGGYSVFKSNLHAALSYFGNTNWKTHIEISIPIEHDWSADDHFWDEVIDTIKEYEYRRVPQRIAIHLLRLFPANKTTEMPSTSKKLVLDVRKKLIEHFPFVYCQNIFGEDGFRDTVCPKCQQKIISRQGLKSTIHKKAADNSCSDCIANYIEL